MTAALVALAAAYGTFLLYTAVAFGWRGIGFGPTVTTRRPRRPIIGKWLADAGLIELRSLELAALVGAVALVGGIAGWALFGGVVPPLLLAAFAALVPLASVRARRRLRRARAQGEWPRLLEELRVLTGSAGYSIPQALFDVGLRGPTELRGGFEAARREWLLSTDFERSVSVLKEHLADPTADVACETLLIAHEVGGTDLDARLEALIEDRIQDTQGRKDARARQAGVRFARRFVLLVPLGMALAGMSVGSGREAYQTPLGQLAVVVGIGMVALCWFWAGRIMRVPAEQRVFPE